MSAAKPLAAILHQALADRPATDFFVDENMESIPFEQIPEEFRKTSAFLPVLVLVPRSMLPRDTAEPRFPSAIDAMRTAVSNCASPLHVMKSRPTNSARQETIKFGDVCVNLLTMEVHRRGRLVELTSKGFKMLAYLAANSGRVVSREELLTQVWGYNCYPCTRTIDNHILQLRKKLEHAPANPCHFLTVHGTGYKFIP